MKQKKSVLQTTVYIPIKLISEIDGLREIHKRSRNIMIEILLEMGLQAMAEKEASNAAS